MLCEKLCKYPKNFKLPFKARLNQVQFNSGLVSSIGLKIQITTLLKELILIVSSKRLNNRKEAEGAQDDL